MRDPEHISEAIKELNDLEKKYGRNKAVIMFLTGLNSDKIEELGGINNG